MPQDWTELLCITAVNFQHGVSPASEARVLSESICVSYKNTHVGQVLAACCYCPLLAQQLESDEYLNRGEISFTTARPLVPATRVVRRCRPIFGRIRIFPFLPGSRLRVFIAMQLQHSYHSSSNG